MNDEQQQRFNNIFLKEKTNGELFDIKLRKRRLD